MSMTRRVVVFSLVNKFNDVLRIVNLMQKLNTNERCTIRGSRLSRKGA